MGFPKIDVTSGAGTKSDAAVLGWFQGEGEAKGGFTAPQYTGERTAEVEQLASRLGESKHFFGRSKEVSVLRYYPHGPYPNAVLMGLGPRAQWTPESAREAGGNVFFTQRMNRLSRVTVLGGSVFPGEGGASVERYLQSFAEGYLMASYDYLEMRETPKDLFQPKGVEIAGVDAALAKKAVTRGVALAEAVNLARLLGDQPGNVLTPAELGRVAQQMCRKYQIQCRVLGKAQLEKEKMGLFLGVAQGSAEEPKMIIMNYNGGKKTDRPVALVGKGITFDTGGISIKPAQKMEEMKYDMMGAAAVIGIMQAVAALKLPINVVGYVGAAENMPDGKAQKPGDIARSLSGKTVEIVNTDAEGRLVLADVLEYAQLRAKPKPQAILDFATLTGAVLVALGTVTTGIMGTHPELIQRLKEASRRTGERVWELPLYDDYDEDLKSNYADYKNSGVRDAGSSKGGTFLKFFVEKGMPWVHCDIAGTAWARKDAGYLPTKYASGVMVRTVFDLLENWKPLSG